MNTSEVAKLLGVSASTIQRWVKQLGLPMEKNDRGHYHFNNEDINQLKEIHEKLQNGTLLHEITPVNENKVRKGTVRSGENDKALENLYTKVQGLEKKLHDKADSVASYQLLQHRREIEDLQGQVKYLTQQLELLQNQLDEHLKSFQKDQQMVQEQGKVKRKKKNFVSSIFGF